MQKSDLFVAQMMADLVGRKTGKISKVEYQPQKPAFRETSETETHLSRSSPESCGISSAWVTRLFRRLAAEKVCGMHRIMVLRGNTVIGETAFAPFNMDEWHVTHSLCKSMTGMAIGMLIAEDKLHLDDRIADIFRDERSLLTRLFITDRITIRHLLTMTSGVKYNETGAISGNTWLHDYLESGTNFEPGTSFEYNSMNSYVLSAVVTKLTGETLMEYLRPRLWEPLGIDRIYWESSPEQITKGGWGMFIRIEDMAKLGRLYLQKGVWEGRRILPAEWIEESVGTKIPTGMDRCDLYGYHLWLNEDRGTTAWSFNGMLGQNVFGYPDLDMVICTNAANEEVFQQGRMSRIIRDMMKELTPADSLPEDPNALNELKLLCKRIQGRSARPLEVASGGWPRSGCSLWTVNIGSRSSRKAAYRYRTDGSESARIKQKEHFRRIWMNRFVGKVYDLDSTGEGVFPLLTQVIHNNFTDGITSIGFRKSSGGSLTIDLYEGTNVYPIPCGFFGNFGRMELDLHGEFYRIAVRSDLTTDENGFYVLKNEIVYTEEAAARIINICFDPQTIAGNEDPSAAPERIELRFDETPGSSMILPSLEMITTQKASGLDGFFIKQFSDFGGMDAIGMLAYATIRPVVSARLRITEQLKEGRQE